MKNEENIDLYTMARLQKYCRDLPYVLQDYEDTHKKMMDHVRANNSINRYMRRKIIRRENFIKMKFKSFFYWTYHDGLETLENGFVILGLPDNFDLSPEI